MDIAELFDEIDFTRQIEQIYIIKNFPYNNGIIKTFIFKSSN